jgi:glycosyltransferase involved in cell wall biosynthesis
MKARIKNTAHKNYITSDIVLSVGMIVKNEEKHLENCLSALKPLLDAVESELIIVDTGSTDKTVEIAQKFTDKVFHFDWVNDFSAARNFSLEKCTGQWFMFLDGDEIFDDVDELISFFTDKNALKKYNSAVYIQRNYTKPDGSQWGDYVPSRIVKNFEGLQFHSPIHENFSDFPEPTMEFKAFVHHWGYAHETEEQKKAKDQRNLPLLQAEIKKNPNDMRMRFLLIGNLSNEEREEYFPELLDIAFNLPDKYWASIALTYITLHYYNIEDYGKAIAYHNEFFKLMENKEDSVLFLDMHVTKAMIMRKHGDLYEAVKSFEKYFYLYELYLKGKLSTSQARAVSLSCHKPEEYERIKLIYSEVKSGEGERQMKSKIAMELVKNINLNPNINLNQGNKIVLSVGMIVKNEEKMLEDCLSALKPLLEAVPSELIIVDTGSEDKTVEIAGKFTDKIYHFDWVNDFSAARNFSLEKCTGQWFMYLDADEIFDDLSEMKNFFNDKNALKKFNSATYMRRDYTKPDGSAWNMFAVGRIIKMFPGLHFVNPIHEGFSEMPGPLVNLKTYVHHWGYAFEDVEQEASKRQRNLILLRKELEKNPDDLRTHLHILNDVSDEERERLIPEVFEKARSQPKDQWAAIVFVRTIVYNYRKGEIDKALGFIDEYLTLFKNRIEDVLLLEIFATKGELLHKQNKHEEARKAFDNYFKLYKKYAAGRLSTMGMGGVALEYCEPEGHAKIMAIYNKLPVKSEPVFKNTADGDIVLSISMIVKNEEKMLGACLDAIKPLLEGVKSELVIIDTGSTDKTVIIAKQYTNKIYHFDWINDFSAARNFGLEKCRGQWFMFLDADDHFTDVSELINFFNDKKLNSKYNAAYYVTRNYTTPERNIYLNLDNLRIARRTEDLIFVGAIHEYLTAREPFIHLDTYAWHYGYSFESEEQKQVKVKRNLDLLENELLEKPGNMRTIIHLLPLINNFERKAKIIDDAMPVALEKRDAYSFALMHLAYTIYGDEGKTDEAFEIMDKTEEAVKPNNAILGEIYAYRAILHYKQNDKSKAAENIKIYLDYYDRYEKNELDRSVFACIASNYLTTSSQIELKCTLALHLAQQNEFKEAFDLFDDVDFSEITPEIYKLIVNTAAEIAVNAAAHENLVKLYEKIADLDDGKLTYIEQKLEELYFADKTIAKKFGTAEGKFAELMRICAGDDKTAIEEFINSFDSLPEGYSEAVYLMLENNLDLNPALVKMNYEQIEIHLETLAKFKTEMPKKAINYKGEQYYFSSIKNLLFGAMLFETAIKGIGMSKVTHGDKYALYTRYSKYISLYAANIYNPDLLNEDDLGTLPENHRFGYFMGTAQKALDAGNKLGYIKELKKALGSCKSMTNIIRFLLEDFTAKL